MRTEESRDRCDHIDRCPELTVNLIILEDNSWQIICKFVSVETVAQATRILLKV